MLDGEPLLLGANMSQTFYVLMEQGWDYNDEYYFHIDGGNPHKVFTDKERADKVADELNLEQFKELFTNGEIREYSYGGLEEILSGEGSEEDLYGEGLFKTLFGKTAYDWWKSLNEDCELLVEPTKEQWRTLMNCFSLNFWEVAEVQKG